MVIREAFLDDVDALHALGQNVSEFSVQAETVTFWPKEVLVCAVQSDDVVILIAEKEGIVGFLIVNYNDGLKKAFIENIYVHPDMRGQGIGEKLLDRIFTLMAERGCQYVATLVPSDARSAIALYERSGFTKGESFRWLDKSLADSFKK